MLHVIRLRARLLLGLLVILTLLLSVGFLTTHPTIKAHADDGDTPTASCTNLYHLTAGVLTAGHCPISNPIWRQSSEGVDAQLIPDTGGNSNVFQDNSVPITIQVQDFASAEEVGQGQTICTIGGNQGVYRCGNIVRLDYGPSYVFKRTFSFILVNVSCEGGDSGSPWFSSYPDSSDSGLIWKAVGITSGVTANGSCIISPMSSIMASARAATGLGDSLQFINGASAGSGNN